MSNPKVSIIVPIYNNEHYLADTLESIRVQSFTDFEVIVINDGSVDNSEAVIDTFVEKDSRFIKISQENQGVSAARNAGLKIARGEYIGFADGDDTLPQGALQAMDNIARNYPCELIIGGVNKFDGYTKKLNLRVEALKYKRNIRRDDLDLVHGLSLWNKWFSHDVIKKYNVEFEPFRHLQDGVFLYRFLRHVDKIFFCDTIVYNYNKRIPLDGGSVTQAVRPGLIKQAVGSYNRICDYTEDYPEEFKQELAYRMNSTTIIGDYYKKIWYLNEEDEALLLETIEKLWNRVSDDHRRRIVKSHKGAQFQKGFRSKEQILEDVLITVAVVPGLSDRGLGLMLKSLYGQAVPSFNVVVDKSYESVLPEVFRKMKNLEIAEVNRSDNKVFKSAKGKYLLVVDRDIIFDYDTLEMAYALIEKKKKDVIRIKIKNFKDKYSFSNKFMNVENVLATGFHFTGVLKNDSDSLLEVCASVIQNDAPVIDISPEKPAEQTAKKEPQPLYKRVIRKMKKMMSSEQKPEEVKKEKPVEKPAEVQAEKKIDGDALDYYLYAPVKANTVLLEGLGKHVKGSMLQILKEFKKPEYQHLKVYVVIGKDNKDSVSELLKCSDITVEELVVIESKRYKELIFTAEYLVNEVHFPNYWIKKPEQKYINLWHGTPLKTLAAGKKDGYVHEDGPAMRDFIWADYLLYPNDFTRKQLLDDYYVSKLVNGKALMLGYPRTGAMLCDEQEQAVYRKKVAPNGETVIAYMPTYRSDLRQDEQVKIIQQLFAELEEKLPEDYLVYVNLHHRIEGAVDYKNCKKIRNFPADMDTYQVLAATDCLCTDYSSLLFDFAATGKKIVLYTYDLDEYTEDRGLYMDMKELPFPNVATVDELIKEFQLPKAYDDAEFVEQFCKYDSVHNAEYFCQSMFLGQFENVTVEKVNEETPEVTMVFSDGWHACEATEKMYALAKEGKLEENIYLSYKNNFVKNNLDESYPLLKEAKSIGTKGKQLFTKDQKAIKQQYMDGKISFAEAMEQLEPAYKTEKQRCYGTLKIKTAVLYDTLDADKIIAFAYFDSEKYLLVHEDLAELIECGNQYISDAIKFFEEHGGKVVK